MSAPIHENFCLRGRLTIRVRDAKSGRRLYEHVIKNMIVNRGFGNVILLLGQTTESGADLNPLVTTLPSLRITRLRVGEDATAPTRDQTVMAPGYVELTPHVQTYTDSVRDGTELEPYELVASATLESVTPANGKTLREASLFTTGLPVPTVDPESQPRMIARQIHPAVTKTLGISIEYEWHLAINS
jgi:hypothetical protein